MSIFRCIVRELCFRWGNTLPTLAALTTAAAAFVLGPTLLDGYRRQTERQTEAFEKDTKAQLAEMEAGTIRAMRDMGFNLIIVHRDAQMADFWASDFASVDMPQEYIDRLARAPDLTLITHLVATLQQRVSWNGRSVLLVGYLPEKQQPNRPKKSPMGYNIPAGAVYLGSELAQGRKVGEEIDVLGRRLKIARLLPASGTKEDITLAVRLADAQAMLQKPGRINQILALQCHCAGDRMGQVREQLARALPDSKVTEYRSIALARAEQRDLVAAHREKMQGTLAEERARSTALLERLIAVATPIVVLACGLGVMMLSLANLRERRIEIGLFRAVGVPSARILATLLGKPLLLGLAGGVLGLLIGGGAARWIGPAWMEISPGDVAPAPDVAWGAALGAPIASLLAGWLPVVWTLGQDPAEILREA